LVFFNALFKRKSFIIIRYSVFYINMKLGSNSHTTSSDAGKMFGYTNDYVARLARERKIVATRVGRQWYVDIESLRGFIQRAEEAKKEMREKVRGERLRERVSLGKSSGTVSVLRSPVPRVVVLAKTGVVLSVSAILGLLIFINIQGFNPENNFTASVFDSLRSFAVRLYGFSNNAPAFVGGAHLQRYSQESTRESTKESETSVSHMVVVPDATSLSNEEIKKSFSDEVMVEYDSSEEGGVITPHFRSGTGTPYRFLMVPMNVP